MSLFSTLEKWCLQKGFEQTYWIGYSGGLDSHVLLHLLAALRALHPILIHAVYINHSLSPHAHAWAAHCAAVCETLKIEFTQQTIQAKSASGESPEEVAREGRYAVFSEILQPNDLLLTAHHQDDQAETVLLQLVRGAGPKGLAAMPVIKPLGRGFLVRPLLNSSRRDLQAYAEQNHLNWIEDESNTNTHFSRNFIRHEVLPLLAQRWPEVAKTLARTAAHCADAQNLLEDSAQQDLFAGVGSMPGTLSVSFLLQLPISRQRQLLRFWLQQQNHILPGTIKMQQIIQDMLGAKVDKAPCVAWDEVELRRYRDDLHVMKRLQPHDQTQVWDWDTQSDLTLQTVGVLRATLTEGTGFRAGLKDVTVRFRQGGEVCRLPNRGCQHTLKNLFWEWNVLPWERDRIPLVFVADSLAAAPGYFVAEAFKAAANEPGYHFSFDPFP
jgi:tRNA(Ile)-lysidine synthase